MAVKWGEWVGKRERSGCQEETWLLEAMAHEDEDHIASNVDEAEREGPATSLHQAPFSFLLGTFRSFTTQVLSICLDVLKLQ